jgi:hypothetical protein
MAGLDLPYMWALIAPPEAGQKTLPERDCVSLGEAMLLETIGPF